MKELKTVNFGEGLLTVLLFGWIAAALLGGMQLIGLVHLPSSAVPYIGGALLGYVAVCGMIITHAGVKFVIKKG